MTPRHRSNAERLDQDYTARYGTWGLIAGASEGLGAAYAHALAKRGLNLVLVARRRPLLESLAENIRDSYGVDVRCLDGDLAGLEFLESLRFECADLDLGLIVYNATHAPIGELVSVAREDLMRVADVNVRAPMALLRALLPGMTRRGRGGVILMTSMAGNQGSPRLAAYAASKAFTRVLAESLWHELKSQGIDVLGCCAGAVRTPGYEMAADKAAPGTLEPEDVVEEALQALGRGPVVIPGFVNRVAGMLMTRILPRKVAIGIMAGSIGGLTSTSTAEG